MNDPHNYIVLNGACIPEKQAKIPAGISGLYYGAGCFETFTSEKGDIFKFDEHIGRLNRGLKYLGASEGGMIEGESILAQIHTLLTKNNLTNKRSRIRIQVSLAEKNGYSKNGDSPTIIIITANSAERVSHPKKLVLSETSVVPSSARPSELKLSNMLHYRQAFREAEQKDSDDAILITGKGFVAETSLANIFWKMDDMIFTPSIECNILPGIMRNSIIEIFKNRKEFEVKEGRFSMDELLKADFVWLTNSVIEFVEVSQIEKTTFKTDEPFFSDLRNELNTYKKEHSTHV